MALISRDPFAREELHQETVATTSSCKWCGQTRKSGKLFQYYTELDNGHIYYHNGLFCSKGCHDAYHN